jgi:hypothetical protein
VSLGTWLVTKNISTDGNFRNVSQFLTSHVEEGDVVIIPKPSIYWGVMRYAVGPNWGEPLNIMPLKDNEEWIKLKTKLGPQLASQMGLNPVADNVYSNGARYIIGKVVDRDLQKVPHTWIVHCNRYNDIVTVSHPLRLALVDHVGSDITISKMVPDQAGSVLLSNPDKLTR